MYSYNFVALFALGGLPKVYCSSNLSTPLYSNSTTAGDGRVSAAAGHSTSNATTSKTSHCPPSISISASERRLPVIVGARGELRFSPNELDANVGDVIEFTFLALNHTLTQSSLSNPCANLGGFSTGFSQFNPKNESGKFVVEHQVTTIDPQWFFCAQIKPKSHCQAGMVFALNAGDKMSAFLSAATVESSSEDASTSKLVVDADKSAKRTIEASTTTTGVTLQDVTSAPSPTSVSFTQTSTARNTSVVTPGVSVGPSSASTTTKSRRATLAVSIAFLGSLFYLF